MILLPIDGPKSYTLNLQVNSKLVLTIMKDCVQQVLCITLDYIIDRNTEPD